MAEHEKREKVISDLEEQIAWIRDNDFHKFPGWGHSVLAMRDALELLKAQQQEPTSTPEAEWLLYKGRQGATCSFCKHTYHDVYDVESYDYYCRHCGSKMIRIRAVKWE